MSYVKHHVLHQVVLKLYTGILYYIKKDVGNSNNYTNFMPDRCFWILICGPSGSGKTNTLHHMIMNLLYFDKCYLYTKNLEKSQYEYLVKPISKEISCDILEVRNDEMKPVSEMSSVKQNLVIF